MADRLQLGQARHHDHGLLGRVGSNNMLLYLAGLSNVPAELYEAADIDGASRFQKFWNITWPQLAPDDLLHRGHERDRRPAGRLRNRPGP